MVKIDERKSLIVSTAAHYFGVSIPHEDLFPNGTPEVDKFLEEPGCRTLCAQPRGMDNESLKLTIQLPSRGGNTLVFFKVIEAAVTDENFHDLVQVATTGSSAKRSPTETGERSALVSALRLVWAPALQRAGVSGNLLKNLEEGLIGPRASITVIEEQTKWERRANVVTNNSEERRIALEAAEILKRLRVELDRVASSRDGIEGAEEALEAVSGYVDDLWKLEGPVYSEDRIKSLLDLIGNEVILIVNAQIAAVDEKSQAKDEAVASGATLCEKWILSSERLTGLFWPHQSLHPWKGAAHRPERCAKLGKRLRLLAELRAQHRQLVRLLTPSERAALGADQLLRAFDEMQALGADEDEAAWERVKRNIEESLAPAEERVAGKLRAQFSGVRGPAGLAGEFRRYGELLKREGLRRALRGERETLLAAIGGLVESCQVGPDTVRLIDSPRILQEIQASRTAEIRLEGLKKLGKELLADLSGFEEAAGRINSALKETAARKQELVESWTNEIRAAIISKELSLDADGSVVELTGASMMRVTYDPRLTQLVREVRALAGQGVELPREIGALAERAGSLAGRARALQQVATFHNTIGDRMVPSQRPLMLVAALELARAVREQSGVAWNDPQRVDAYTARLRELVRKFGRQNSELSGKHLALGERVAGLLKGDGVNLASNHNGWKEALRNMRTTVDAVEAEYGNTKAWKLHWDRQLMKALGVAYRAALPSLLQKLPELRLELVFREGRLQWRPPIEEVRAKLYSGLRRFLAIPTNFRGVGDSSEGQFSGLVRRSAYLFGRVYQDAEILLAAIEETRLKWIPLSAPARIDPGERLKGKPPAEWEKAFKDAKQWAQEVGRLRGSEIRLLCIRVETGTARGDLESTTRRSWERLSVDLRTEASSRLVSVVEFLSSASKELDRRPRSVEEVGIAREAYSRIQKDASGMAKELEEVAGLARVLAAWTRERLEGVSGAKAAWEGLAGRLEKHQTVIARHVEDAKLNLRHRYIALRDDRERWEVRWNERPEIVDAEWLATTRERWQTFKDTRESLDDECRRLGLSIEEIGGDLEASEEFNEVEIEAELDAIETSCRVQNEFIEELSKQEAEEWGVARRRLLRFQDWLDSWEARLKTPETGIERRETFVGKRIADIRKALEAAQNLRSDDLVEEHWTELSELLGLTAKRYQDITLGNILNAASAIADNIDQIKIIAKRATAESGIRQALVELESWEGSASLPIQTLKDSQGMNVHLVIEYAGLLTRAGELRLLLEGARGSSSYERFAARALRWEAALSELEERVRILSAVQRKWVYLEPIFGGGAAPNESAKWIRADKEFRYFTNEISRDPRVPALRRLPLPTLTDLKDGLDRCQRSLDDFLEEKRAAYPRLYFLSDEDLLELVSGGRGLEAHLPKLYPGVGTAVTEGNFIKAVLSPEGELLKLPREVQLTEPLPEWLAALENGIREALSLSLDECLADSTPDPSRYPAQILILSERIRFTERCERAMREGKSSLKNLVEALEAQRARYRGLEDIGDKLTALKARGLLLDVVHHLGVVRSLIESTKSVASNVAKVSWDWNRQLRTYRRTSDVGGPTIRCAGAEFPYRFEYQGASIGLVRTPLTERCFLALTQAMRLGLGGSPTGPAGTGKTESVKALGGILGRLVLVFNCDEGMDAGSVRRILGGLAQSGAWGCFDEFNRLKEETLSAVSMLVGPLQEAVRDGAEIVELGGERVTLDPHCCIFITMNPAGAEYGGRHRLPDSLARLFRPVAMAHPDRLDIAGSLLECAGFLEAKTLAKKLVEALDLAEKLLSKQPHYDWGLRALRSVLEAVYYQSSGGTRRSEAETTRLLEGLRIAVMPKLTETDSTKFMVLLSDIFPKENQESSGKDRPSSSGVFRDSVELYTAVDEICKASGLGIEFCERCVQLDQQLQARAGVAIVGPPGSGKSLLWKTLANAMNRLGKTVSQLLVYPGAVAKTTLLGRVDPRTREWKEGIISSSVANAGMKYTWIILDGDVEPGWAEALNSALDDNRLLTLANGVGIRLGAETRFIFETHRLDGASPATVSRLGVVHLGSLSSNKLVSSSRLEFLSSEVRTVASSHLPTGIDAVLKINGQNSSASGLADAAFAHLGRTKTRVRAALALVQSLCAGIAEHTARDNLARNFYEIIDCRCPDLKKPCAVTYDLERDRLEPLDDDVVSLDTDEGPLCLSGSVKIALGSITPWIESGHPVLLRGSSGSGKSSIIAAAIASMGETRAGSFLVRGSSLHGPEELIARLKRACIQVETSSANGRTYRPRNGRRLILLLEDIHLASKDLQELTRQLLQEGGFYEDDLEFAKLPITAICTAEIATPLHPRLESLLATYHVPKPRSKELLAIVELHLRTAYKQNGAVKEFMDSWISRLAAAMLEAFRGIPTSNSQFTTRDLAGWADALELYPIPEDVSQAIKHVVDAGRRLFSARLNPKERSRWEATVLARFPEARGVGDDVYAWKGISGGSGLVPFTAEQWKQEVETAALRCAREGQPIEAKMTSQFLDLVGGVSWAFGRGQRGRGGLALIGRPGAGRKTSSRLAAMLSSLNFINGAPGRGRAGVRAAVQSAGIEGESTLLLLEEHHLREEGVAVLVAALIDKGEIPGLVSPEELDGMLVPLGELARREDFAGSLEQYLQHRLKRLLRVAVIIDEGDTREDLITRSGLLRSCVIIGGDNWWTSDLALTELAMLRWVDQDKNQDPDVEIIVKANLAVKKSEEQQTPASFHALLHSYEELRMKWSEEIDQEILSLEAGIGRLREAGERVGKLEAEASKQREELEAEKGKAASALEQITATMRGATGQREEMTILKAETERESAEVARRKGDIEAELGLVEPLVAEAAQAVAGISADALAEVRSLRAPPAPVRDVLEGVLRLMGIRDTSWNSMKTFLAKRGVKDELRTWDARRSSSTSLDAVEKLVNERPESFEEKTAKRVSVAAAPLANWVLANLKYGQVLRDVAPLEREQRILAERLSTAEAQLGRLAAGLNSVEGRVAQLQEELAEHSRGVAALQLRAESTESSLAAAQGLLQSLAAEHRDWEEHYRHLTARKTRLSIEAAGAATLLVYQTVFDKPEDLKTPVDLLTTERERISWRAQGLPVDNDSLIGAVRALKGPLVPLFLDPSGVAVSWLKTNQAVRGLEVTRPLEPRFLTTVELAVRFGKPLLIEEIDILPAVLLPLLRRGALRIGERILAAQPGFRLFLATRRESLIRGTELPREAVVARVVLAAGMSSLAERLVERALLLETPGLEEERKAALEREEKLAGERDAARIELLARLGATRGEDILLGGLLGSLEATQTKAKEIARALEESGRSLEDVAKRAGEHRPFADFAARIFEAVKLLPRLAPLYVFSAEEFTDLYLRTLKHRDLDADAKKRRLITITMQYCARAVYRKHRLPLALHLVLAISGDVRKSEKSFLLEESIASTTVTTVPPDWIPEERKPAVSLLMNLIPEIGANISPSWLADVSKIFTDGSLTQLQKTLVIKALRPDYLHTALVKLASVQLGVRDIAPPAFSLAKGDWGDRPVLFLLSPGADPAPELRSLATNAGTSFVQVSLGQGQLEQAELALETTGREGGWLLLSNLQLALNWLPRLESLLRSPALTTERNSNARVWLTTEECIAGFYPGLSALCAKIAYEPPEGVKRNVKRSLQQLSQQQQETGSTSEAILLSWLHATLQERRRFVPQGWIKVYEWSETDLEAGSKLVSGSASRGDWEGGRGLLDAAVYGGRLQDAYDARALRAILKDIWAGDVYSGRRNLGGILALPEASAHRDTVKLLQTVDQLPDHDPPTEYFGLPANADRAWERAAAENAIGLLRGLAQEVTSLRIKNSEEDAVAGVSPSLEKLLNELRRPRSSKNDRSQDPLEEFFFHERKSGLKLLKNVEKRIESLIDTLSGISKTTPKEWTEAWPTGPEKAVSFAWRAADRYRILCIPEVGIPERIDLSLLGKPEAFFAALKQRTARRTGLPIEELLLRAEWSDFTENNKDEGSRCGLEIEGLLLTGAAIRNGRLDELSNDEAPVLTAPRCRLSYFVKNPGESDVGRPSLDWIIDVPVYTDLRRNQLISAIPVPCNREHRDTWLRRGVALHLTA